MPQVTPLFLENRGKELDSLVKDLGPDISTRITIVNADGVVVADSEKDPGLMENHRFRPEILQVLEGEPGTSIRFSSTVKEEMLYVAVPIPGQEKTAGVLRVSLFLADFNKMFSQVKKSILYSAIGISLVALLAAFLLQQERGTAGTRAERRLAQAGCRGFYHTGLNPGHRRDAGPRQQL